MEVSYRRSTQDKYSLITNYTGLHAAGDYIWTFYIGLKLYEAFYMCKVKTQQKTGYLNSYC